MRLSKKQIKLVELLEKCGGLYLHEINQQEYPMSMVASLNVKGAISIDDTNNLVKSLMR